MSSHCPSGANENLCARGTIEMNSSESMGIRVGSINARSNSVPVVYCTCSAFSSSSATDTLVIKLKRGGRHKDKR